MRRIGWEEIMNEEEQINRRLAYRDENWLIAYDNS